MTRDDFRRSLATLTGWQCELKSDGNPEETYEEWQIVVGNPETTGYPITRWSPPELDVDLAGAWKTLEWVRDFYGVESEEMLRIFRWMKPYGNKFLIFNADEMAENLARAIYFALTGEEPELPPGEAGPQEGGDGAL